MWELFHQALHEHLGANCKLHPFLNGPEQDCDENGVKPLWTGEETTHRLRSAAEFPSCSQLPAYTAAAAAVCHQVSQSSIIYFQIICKALHHSLLSMHKEKTDRASAKLGNTKAEKHLKSFALEIVLCSYNQGREERKITSYPTKICYLHTNSFDLSISFVAVNNSF